MLRYDYGGFGNELLSAKEGMKTSIVRIFLYSFCSKNEVIVKEFALEKVSAGSKSVTVYCLFLIFFEGPQKRRIKQNFVQNE